MKEETHINGCVCVRLCTYDELVNDECDDEM